MGRIIRPSLFPVSVSVPLSFSRLPRVRCHPDNHRVRPTICRAEAIIVFRIVGRRDEDRRQS